MNGDYSATTQIIEDINVNVLIRVKDKTYKFKQSTYDVCELAWNIDVPSGEINLNPLTYNHLINIVEIFKRPLAKSGDADKLKNHERENIFLNAQQYCIVKKKGNTLKFWYEYVAVFSGSYIYFYPIEYYEAIKVVFKFFKKDQEGGGQKGEDDAVISSENTKLIMEKKAEAAK